MMNQSRSPSVLPRRPRNEITAFEPANEATFVSRQREDSRRSSLGLPSRDDSTRSSLGLPIRDRTRDVSPTSISRDVVHVERVKRLELGSENVYGVAQLTPFIYVVCVGSNTIRIYDARTFERHPDAVVEDVDNETLHAADIAACSLNNCLYVSDWKNHCVWRLADSGREAHKWVHASDQDCMGTLSVTSEGRVVMLRRNPPALDIYGADARLERTIPLPSDMEEPQDALETMEGNFLVSHGWMDSPLHRICELTQDGRVIKSYGGQRGAGARLNGPIHMTLDTDGRVFVADYMNNRVVVVDPELNLCRVVLTRAEDEVPYRPWRLCYVADVRRLLVAHRGYLHVYSVGPYASTGEASASSDSRVI